MGKYNIIYFFRTTAIPDLAKLNGTSWTILCENDHIRNFEILDIYLDRFKKFENYIIFQIQNMLTSSIIMLSVFGGLVAILVLLRCIVCMQSCYINCKYPGQERDTFRYKTSGMALDCFCGICLKIPVAICAKIWCPEDNVITIDV